MLQRLKQRIQLRQMHPLLRLQPFDCFDPFCELALKTEGRNGNFKRPNVIKIQSCLYALPVAPGYLTLTSG